MFRTVLIRNQVASNGLKKTLQSNVTRCFSEDKINLRLCSVICTRLPRRKQIDRATLSSSKTVLGTQWSIQARQYSSLPSHKKVNLPALSPTMESGTIVKWEKKEGDKLNEGDLLCEIETDKATMGFETPEEGYLAKILINAGAKGVPVGKLLCIIVENQEDVAAFKDFKDDGSSDKIVKPEAKEEKPEAKPAPAAAPTPSPAAPAARAPAPAPAPSSAPISAPTPSQDRVYASPLARRLAELRNLRLGGHLAGSGLYGSLKSGDLDSAGAAAAQEHVPAPAPAPGASYVDIPLTGMRETIAKRLLASKQTIPHYQLMMTVNVEKTLAVRKAVNEKLSKDGVKVSVNDFIIKALAAAAKKVPTVNSYWMDTYIRQFSNVDVSVAVATPTGLITPIIHNADSRGIVDISKVMKELAEKAKSGRLAPHEYQGGTITVSNLGMFGITMFNAIINPPQSFILAVGGLQQLAVPDGDGGYKQGQFITITGSADHRVIDGAVGAQFMKLLKDNLEDPTNIIM